MTALLVFGAVVGLADLILVRASVPSMAQTLSYAATIIILLTPMAWVIIRRPLWAKAAWVIILVVLSLVVVGLLIRQFTQGGQRSGDLTTAGGADAVFAIAYGTALLALIVMVRKVHRRPEPLWSIDAAIAFLAVWTIGAELILVPLLDQGAGALSMLIQAFYLSVNAGLVGLGVRLGLTTEKGHNRALRTGFIGVALFGINDIVSTSGLITGTQVGIRNGIYTAANVIAIALISAAACDPTAVNAPSRSPHQGRLSAARSVAAVIVVAAVGGVVVFRLNVVFDWLLVVLVVLVVVLLGLLALRSVVIVHAYQQVVDREESLRSATATMIAAEAADDVDAAYGRALEQLLPEDRVRWEWSTPAAELPPHSGVLLDEAPAAALDGNQHRYRYSSGDGRDELTSELRTPLLLDPLDWAGVRALTDVAVQARSRLRLREDREQASEAARLSAMLAGAQDMVVMLDDDGVIQLALGAVDELTNRAASEWTGVPLGELFVDGADVVAAARTPEVRRRRVVAQISGSAAKVEATVVRFASGEVSVSLHDVTERIELTSELEYRANHDALTGLPNRTHLEYLLGQADRRWRAEEMGYAVVFLDIDDFKVVNDSLGHRLGDALLVGLANRFRDAVGERGTVARMGGDEFAVLLPGMTVVEAMQLASNVTDTLATPLVIEGVEVLVRASAGVAATEDPRDDGEFLLQAADLALYDARDLGKGHVAPFRSELKDVAARRLHDANAVTVAARERAFRFDYQPIVNIVDGHAVAMEALMRWDRGRDLQRPDSFIPIAESLGELTRMLRDVMPSALDQLEAWREQDPDLLLAVNMHAGALMDGEFVDWLLAAIEDRGLPMSSVILEVSERSIVPSQADRHLTRLRDRGMPIWIDDFGTGWSNLSSLERLPVTGIKLARELVIDGSGGVKADLVKAVMSLADAVGFTVTAEGVETPEQLDQLAELGVTIVQGYLVGRPMPSPDAGAWLDHTRAPR